MVAVADPGLHGAVDHEPSPDRWKLVGLLWLACFLNQADRQVFNVVLPLISDDLALSAAQLGLIATTFTIVFGVAVPLAGIAGDRYDRRWIVCLSLLTFSFGTLMTGLVSTYLLLLIFRGVATGVGEAFYTPIATPMIASAHGATTRARALSVHQSANYAGVVLGSLIAAWLGQTLGWRSAFLAHGLLGVVWTVVLFTGLRRLRLPPQRRIDSAVGSMRAVKEAVGLVLARPTLMAQMLAFGGLLFALVGFLTWSPTLLYERFGLSLVNAGFSSVSYHHLGGLIGVIGASWFADRTIRRWPGVRLTIMAIGLIGSGLFIWIAAIVPDLWQLYAAFAAFGVARGLYDSGLLAAIFDEVEDRLRSTMTGLLLACGSLIGGASPFIMGTMKASYGIEGGMKLLALFIAATGLVLLATTILSPRRSADPGAPAPARAPS